MSKFGLRHQCAFGALACALALTPAMAQAQDAATSVDDTDLIDNAEVDGGNVIIVRAQGREQALSDVPVAVSAVSGEMLEKSGVADIRDLN
jgi:outer membrane receptor protein involved in Fe transport